MRIRYLKGDPRAGTVVDLEEGLARRKIEAGEAEEVTGKAATTEADKAVKDGAGSTTDATAAPAPAAKTAAPPRREAAKKSGRRS